MTAALPGVWRARLGRLLLRRAHGRHQLGYVDTLGDPFFGNGTEEILNSDNQQGDSHEHDRHASGLHE